MTTGTSGANSGATDPRRPATVTRDLITVGVFTALYFVIMALVGQLGALLPITQVLGPLYIPILCGIPFMLFVTRVTRFGLITAMGWIIGILYLVTGQSWVATVLAFVLAVIADLIAKQGKYRSWPMLVLSFIVFSEMAIGMVVPLFFQRQATLDRIASRGHEQAWINQIVSLTPAWMFYVMIVMIVVGATIGAYVGRGIFHKHFAYLNAGRTRTGA